MEDDTMTTLFAQQKAESDVQVPALESLTKDGRPCRRTPVVDAQIAEYMRLGQTHLISNLRRLHPEAVFFFARQSRHVDEHFYGLLLEDIGRRTVEICQRYLWDVDETDANIIVSNIELDILKLAMEEQPSAAADALEMAFVRAVKRRVFNAVRDYRRSRAGVHVTRVGDLTEPEADMMQRRMELIEDPGISAEVALLELNDRNARHQRLKSACQRVKDRRHLIAVILHHAHGWPIKSKDPEVADLMTYFNASEGEIKYWIKTALESMRNETGGQQ